MNDAEKLKQLALIMAAKRAASEAALARNSQLCRDMRQALSHINQARDDRGHDPAAIGDVANRAGADTRWAFWADQRRATINAELARCLASREGLLDNLRLDFGKEQVTLEMLGRAKSKNPRS